MSKSHLGHWRWWRIQLGIAYLWGKAHFAKGKWLQLWRIHQESTDVSCKGLNIKNFSICRPRGKNQDYYVTLHNYYVTREKLLPGVGHPGGGGGGGGGWACFVPRSPQLETCSGGKATSSRERVWLVGWLLSFYPSDARSQHALSFPRTKSFQVESWWKASWQLN